MNLYDAYMTSRDRADCPPELREVMAPAVAPRAPMPTPMPPAEGAACHRFPSLAMVYAPLQSFRDTYSPEEGLTRGTIFRELDKPLEVVGGRR